jgi:hypothetical protein
LLRVPSVTTLALRWGGGGEDIVLFPLRFPPHAFVGFPSVNTHVSLMGVERVCPLVFSTCPVRSSVGIYEMNLPKKLSLNRENEKVNVSRNLGKIVERILVVNPRNLIS